MPWIVLLLLGGGMIALGVATGRTPRAFGAAARQLTQEEVNRLNALLPSVRARALQLILACQRRGVQLFVGSTLRTQAQQDEKVRQGRSAQRVPYWHGSGRAVDFMVINPRTRQPDTKAELKGYYGVMHDEARRLGGEVFGYRELHTGDGRAFTDPYHVMWKDGLDGAVALARYQGGVDKSYSATVRA